MSRITSLNMSMMDVIIALADGNPGALSAMVEIIRVAEEVDPDAMLGSAAPLLALDTHGIYGSHIWILYSNICEKDAVKLIAVLRAIQLGICTEREILDGIGAYKLAAGRADQLLVLVRERLPDFASATPGQAECAV